MSITKDTVKKISKLSRIASNEKFEENMIKDLWNKAKSYQLSKQGKIFFGAIAVILLIIIVGWAA